MKGGNKREAETIVLARATADRNTMKVFKHLYNVLFAKNIMFDPLGMFTDEEEMAQSQTPADEEDNVEDQMY